MRVDGMLFFVRVLRVLRVCYSPNGPSSTGTRDYSKSSELISNGNTRSLDRDEAKRGWVVAEVEHEDSQQ